MSFLTDIFLYITLTLTALLSAMVIIRYRDDIKVTPLTAVLLAILHTVAGVICVKLFAGMESLSNPYNAGMSLFGALFFLPVLYIAMARVSKRDIKVIFDDFGICVMIALMCVRTNCIVSGCCLGRIINGSSMRWPTRQIEIVFWALMLIGALWKKEHRYINGSIYPIMLMLYGIFRFLIEFFREGNAVIGPFHLAHIWALISFFCGSITYFMMIERAGRSSAVHTYSK